MNFGMNPRILLQIKSVCGVLGRDSMLVFDEGCIRILGSPVGIEPLEP